jgi:hypothetical protein
MKLSRILMRMLLWLSLLGGIFALLADDMASWVTKLMCYGF